MSNEIVVISHANCTDGWGSINVLQKLFAGEEAMFYSFGHGDTALIESIVASCIKKVVIVIDYALPFAVWQKVVAVAKQVITLDHHLSAKKEYESQEISILNKVEDVTFDLLESEQVITCFDMSKSGAMLTKCFALLFGVSFSYAELDVLNMIQDMDLFKKELPHSEHLYAYISNNAMYADGLYNNAQPLSKEELAKGMSYFAYICQNLQHVLTEGKARHCLFLEQVETLAGFADETTLSVQINDQLVEHTGMIINANFLFASELGSLLAKKTNSFAMIYSIVHGKAKISFRSVKDFDCSVLAGLLGGGGHKNASACVVDIETLFDIIEGKTIVK